MQDRVTPRYQEPSKPISWDSALGEMPVYTTFIPRPMRGPKPSTAIGGLFSISIDARKRVIEEVVNRTIDLVQQQEYGPGRFIIAVGHRIFYGAAGIDLGIPRILMSPGDFIGLDDWLSDYGQSRRCHLAYMDEMLFIYPMTPEDYQKYAPHEIRA